MSAAKMVKRWTQWCAVSHGHALSSGGTEFVTDADAARLEAVIETAKRMRDYASCWVIAESIKKCPQLGCTCPPCESARAFDAALAAMGGK